MPDIDKIIQKLSIEIQVAEYSFKDKVSIDLWVLKDALALLEDKRSRGE